MGEDTDGNRQGTPWGGGRDRGGCVPPVGFDGSTMGWDNPTPTASQDDPTKGRCPPRAGHPRARRRSPGGGRGCLWLPRKHDLPARPHDYAFAGIFIPTLALTIAVGMAKIDVRIIRRSRRRRIAPSSTSIVRGNEAFHPPSPTAAIEHDPLRLRVGHECDAFLERGMRSQHRLDEGGEVIHSTRAMPRFVLIIPPRYIRRLLHH